MNPGAAPGPSAIPAGGQAPGYAGPAGYAISGGSPAATGYQGVGYPVAQAGVRYAGFWIRLVAFIVDAILVRVVLIPFKAMFGLGGLALGGFDADNFRHGLGLPYAIFGGGALIFLTIAASWLYEAFMESSSYQATLGKMMFGMKVTDLYGNRISFARATGRHFAKIISGMILCIGFIMIGFTERKQGLHDMMAGTLVRRS
jgi:uncharacterized RDD family membrane protein YckC